MTTMQRSYNGMMRHTTSAGAAAASSCAYEMIVVLLGIAAAMPILLARISLLPAVLVSILLLGVRAQVPFKTSERRYRS